MFSNSINIKRRHSVRSRAETGNSRPSLLDRSANDHIWVHSSQLELGMYVNKLDKPWEQTSFMFQGFVIDSYKLLRQVQSSCEHANVQTHKVGLVYCKSTERLMRSTNL